MIGNHLGRDRIRIDLAVPDFVGHLLNHPNNLGPPAIAQGEDKGHGGIVSGCLHRLMQRFLDLLRQTVYLPDHSQANIIFDHFILLRFKESFQEAH